MKNGRPFETFVPEELLPFLAEYLHVHRPILLRGGEDDHLWITRRGRPFTPKHLTSRMSEVTIRMLGIRVGPHLFRDSLATTIATVDPQHAA